MATTKVRKAEITSNGFNTMAIAGLSELGVGLNSINDVWEEVFGESWSDWCVEQFKLCMADHGNDPIRIAGCALTLMTCLALCDDGSIKEPVKVIESNSVGGLWDKVEDLPEEPIGQGLCQLTKVKLSNGRIVPRCKGDCLDSEMCIGPVIRGKGEKLRLECMCIRRN
ncbi:hypothetical protein [Fulvivirga aurantia]|uniref:hypothetical protein n=1 Tax=Fulvivirga aurantia TaxID=2529383 RepID=UPI0012BD270B|nr:hypothetical protein [Fulvivirga aurantia]